MSRRGPATTAQHRTAARRLLAMRRELRQVLDDLGVGPNSPGGMLAVTAKETDALNALDRAIVACANTLNARMRADGQEPGDWDYSRTIHDVGPDGTEPS